MRSCDEPSRRHLDLHVSTPTECCGDRRCSRKPSSDNVQRMQEDRSVGQPRLRRTPAGKLKGLAASVLQCRAKVLGSGIIACCCCRSASAVKDETADAPQSASPSDCSNVYEAQVWSDLQKLCETLHRCNGSYVQQQLSKSLNSSMTAAVIMCSAVSCNKLLAPQVTMLICINSHHARTTVHCAIVLSICGQQNVGTTVLPFADNGLSRAGER